ncbi:MAG: ABC transporter substrate-binding protein [Bifidobacteriaceae bacterium]|nr:ABC transporter substrate-binding protein [Bifidobacteriaceae bacterium]
MKNKIMRIATAISAISLLVSTAACGLDGDETSSNKSDTVNIGVLYPATGQYAEYGKMFKNGMDLAVKKVNKDGGVGGKTLGLKYFDTQSDAKQSAAVAPRLVSDSSIIAVVGDYSSSASMAASPAFQNAKLVHYGFNNSSPTFTTTGDYVWTPQVSQETFQKANADIVAKKAKKISVVYIENDWGKQAFEYFKKEAEVKGLQIAYSSSYLADTTDYSSMLISATQDSPDAVVDIGYGPDGAGIVNTLRDKIGFTGLFFGGQETSEFLQSAGDNAEGTIITGTFSAAGTTDSKAKQFVADYRNAYGSEPGNFEVTAYQAIIDLAYAANKTSPTREGIQEALKTVKDFPLYQGQGGTFSFNVKTRRADGIQPILLIVKDGKFVQYDDSAK